MDAAARAPIERSGTSGAKHGAVAQIELTGGDRVVVKLDGAAVGNSDGPAVTLTSSPKSAVPPKTWSPKKPLNSSVAVVINDSTEFVTVTRSARTRSRLIVSRAVRCHRQRRLGHRIGGFDRECAAVRHIDCLHGHTAAGTAIEGAGRCRRPNRDCTPDLIDWAVSMWPLSLSVPPSAMPTPYGDGINVDVAAGIERAAEICRPRKSLVSSVPVVVSCPWLMTKT